MEVDLAMAVQKVDLQMPDIEKELSRLWDVRKKEHLAKACLFTLIIYANDKRRVNYLQELVDSILDKFPCRILFIQSEKESDSSYFRVNVSNVSSGQQAFSSSGVSCDQIIIETSHDQLFRVPFLVLPYIVPDLPLYLLWGQNPFEEKDIFPHVQRYARRVIFDSECADDLKLFCKEMLTNLDILKMDIMDVNWALVSNWRDVISELFDTPDKLENLKACKSLVIQYNCLKTETNLHPEMRALYLQGWLASALNWKYQNIEHFETSTILSYYSSLHPVIIGLHPQEIPNLPQGAITSIEIITSTDHTYSITRRDNLPQVSVHISSRNTCELPFYLSLPNIHKGLTFMREIFFGSLGSHYRETLKAIAQINFDSLCKTKGSIR